MAGRAEHWRTVQVDGGPVQRRQQSLWQRRQRSRNPPWLAGGRMTERQGGMVHSMMMQMDLPSMTRSL